MRLGGRLKGAIEVLKEIELRRRPAADALKEWGLSHRFAGAGDRAAIGNIVYDVLRRRASLSWRINSNDLNHIAFAALLNSGLSIELLDRTLAEDRFAPESLPDEQRKAWNQRNLADAPENVQADVPIWCEVPLKRQFGDRWIAEGRALGDRPPLDLRVNTLKSTTAKVLKALSKSDAKAVDWFNQAIRIEPIVGLGRHPNVQAEPSFQKGWFEVQDLGSQIVAHLAGAKDGSQVLDYCAGAGGKTLALAAAMKNRGQIYAYDAAKARLAPIFDRLRRAGVRNAQPHANLTELEPFRNQMDIVLVDAPCTGTGTWRRRPDAKWRLTDGQLERRQIEQSAVLDGAADYVRVNGHLVYITCSLLSEENDWQIKHYLRRHQNFREIDMRGLWKTQTMENAPTPIFPSFGLILSPYSTGTDGFFVSIMERVS